MARYEIARQGQISLKTPSGDNDSVIRDMPYIFGHGKVTKTLWGRYLTYTGLNGLVRATHNRGAYNTTLTTEMPSRGPVSWLALRAYDVIGRRRAEEEPRFSPSKPAGLLAINGFNLSQAAKAQELMAEFPRDFEGITVREADYGYERPGYPANGHSLTRIQIRRPDASMPELVKGVAKAAEILSWAPGGSDTRDHVTRQIKWGDSFDQFEATWEVAMSSATPREAARECMVLIPHEIPPAQFE